MLPPDPDLPLLHNRNYDVDSYMEAPNRIRLRGTVRDEKPAGLYIPEDPDPLTIHHMIVDLVVEVPSMEIVDAEVVFETHPHAECTRITDHYRGLIGISIARGFTHKVRELFGGPRGCTHTTALLQAMAPVAIQSMWSLQAAVARAEGAEPVPSPRRLTDEERTARYARNINTCHVWDSDGELVERLESGEEMEPPVWIVERFESLGLDPAEWLSPMRG
ncbi:MAG: DUF2889 domain-containing protein [Actinomycetota bacterium]